MNVRRRKSFGAHVRFLEKLLKDRLVLSALILCVVLVLSTVVFVRLRVPSESFLTISQTVNFTAATTPSKTTTTISSSDITVVEATKTVQSPKPVVAVNRSPLVGETKDQPPAAALTQPDNNNGNVVIWTRARSDRSGAALQDMLMCHAYAFHHQLTYGGACAWDWSLPQYLGKRPFHENLLQSVGLNRVLRFRCPEDPTTRLMNRQHYIQNDTAIFNPSYLKHLQSLVQYPPSSSATNNNIDGFQKRTIAVHIRRGDISPCRPRTRGYPRYLPNQHFLKLIDRYNSPGNDTSQVVIYSESESFEPFDIFRQRGYRVELDGDIGQVWKGLISSDVLILSRSSFSLVPAVMTKGKVVYTPFWHEPLPHWDVVDEQTVNDTLTEFRRLKATCPNKKNKMRKM